MARFRSLRRHIRRRVNRLSSLRQRRPSDRSDRTSSRQTGALFCLLLFFILLLLGPFLVGRFVYETKYNELKAGYDVATGTLRALKPRLNDLELASRLVAKRVEPSVVSITRPISRRSAATISTARAPA